MAVLRLNCLQNEAAGCGGVCRACMSLKLYHHQNDLGVSSNAVLGLTPRVPDNFPMREPLRTTEAFLTPLLPLYT